MPLSEVAQIIGAKDTREGEVSGAASDREESSDNYYHRVGSPRSHLRILLRRLSETTPARARTPAVAAFRPIHLLYLPSSPPSRQSERTNVTDPVVTMGRTPTPRMKRRARGPAHRGLAFAHVWEPLFRVKR